MTSVAVKFKATATVEAIEAFEKRHRLSVTREIPPLRIRAYEVRPETIAELAADGLVEYVEESEQMQIS